MLVIASFQQFDFDQQITQVCQFFQFLVGSFGCCDLFTVPSILLFSHPPLLGIQGSYGLGYRPTSNVLPHYPAAYPTTSSVIRSAAAFAFLPCHLCYTFRDSPLWFVSFPGNGQSILQPSTMQLGR